ncbi:MAG: oligopeptidase A, partial [Proteobacteria bacterium]
MALAACGGAPPAGEPARPSAPPAASNAQPPTTKTALAALDVDPVAVALGRTQPGSSDDAASLAKARTGVKQLCDEGLAKADALLAAIRLAGKKPDAELRWDNTIALLDQAHLALRNGGDFPGLLAVAHPDEQTREIAKACEPKTEKLETGMWLDAEVAAVVKRYAAKKEQLSPPRARLLERVLRDFRRNGLDLEPAKQARIRELNELITKGAQDFDSNIAASKLFIDATPAELEGLPAEWLAAHPAGPNGTIRVSTDYPDYFPVITYAKNRSVALALYKQFDNRAADKNLALLDRILALRHEKAKLLGYATWADYVIEPRMAKDAKTVAGFLEGLRKHSAKKAAVELA